jgi:hypothetical protein
MAGTGNRILLDSNIWRYIVDAGALSSVQQCARRSRAVLAVSPAVLFEAAHTGSKVLRDALLSAMTRPQWMRLMPEAYSEAEEVKAEVRRLRPEWLRPHKDLTRFNQIRHDWSRSRGGVWDHIKNGAELLQRHDAEMNRRAREQAYALRDDARRWSPELRTATLTKTMASLPAPRPGWSGDPFEAWRIDGLNVFLTSMGTSGHPAQDWLEGEIDLNLMLFQSASLTKFWLHDVETVRMPRHWLRWAFEFLQRQHKVTEGTPGDSQLGTYLVDVDIMLTADRVLANIANRCRKDAPFAVAESMRGTKEEAIGKVMALLER